MALGPRDEPAGVADADAPPTELSIAPKVVLASGEGEGRCVGPSGRECRVMRAPWPGPGDGKYGTPPFPAAVRVREGVNDLHLYKT